MSTVKKEIRAELRDKKKLSVSLRKELMDIDNDSLRAIEIRKLLGTSTLRDILGDKYPIRVCRHCGKRAYTIKDLWMFKPNKLSKHGHDNYCTDCHKLKANDPGINIVGLYCLLELPKQCPQCLRKNSAMHIGARSWFSSRASICKVCVGSHEEVFGFPTRIPTSTVPVVYKGTIYSSISVLSKVLQIPYQIIRRKLLSGTLDNERIP